jgi:hypothetical protein
VSREPRLRPRVVASLLLSAPLVAAGCTFDAGVAVQFPAASPTTVRESLRPEVTPHRVAGVTTRKRQVVRIDCSTTLVYDVREATGSAVLVQTYALHLRTRPLARGTAFAIDCAGPLIVELPADAASIEAAVAASAPLAVQAPVRSVPLAFGRRLRAERGTQLALIRWPPTLAAGNYDVDLAFVLPAAREVRERAVETASVSCGRSRYLQPILPPVTRMRRAPAFTLRPSSTPTTMSLPRVAPGIASYAEATRTLSCR